MAGYSACCPRYTWQRSSAQISPLVAMARRAYVRAAIAWARREAGGHDGSRTSPIPRRYDSTSNSFTRRRPASPGRPVASIMPRYRRPVAPRTTVAPRSGTARRAWMVDEGGGPGVVDGKAVMEVVPRPDTVDRVTPSSWTGPGDVSPGRSSARYRLPS